MPCFHPIPAWPDLRTGEYSFSLDARRELGGKVLVDCRQCLGCRISYSASWALRALHEASEHEAGCFLTLTHDDEHFPESQDEWVRMNRLFLKRYRKAHPELRTFGCLELGDSTLRPHSHLLAMGHSPERGACAGVGAGGTKCFEVPEVQALWPHGFVTVGDLTAESAGYVARYAMKKRSVGDHLGETVEVVHPVTGELISFRPSMPFARARRPGLGAGWFDKYGEQAIEQGFIVDRGGSEKPLPDFYKRRGKKLFGNLGSDASAAAAVRALRNVGETTPERLAVREEVAKARVRELKRGKL